MRQSKSQQRLNKLQNLDLTTWSRILSQHVHKPMHIEKAVKEQLERYHTRYTLFIENHSDPVTFIGRKTSVREAQFHRYLANDVPFLTSRALFTVVEQDHGWVILQESPHDKPTEAWGTGDVEEVVEDLATFHAAFWNKKASLFRHSWLPFYLGMGRKGQRPPHIDSAENDWRSSKLTNHAVQATQSLAPRWQSASNGLTTLLELEGWTGVIEEKHLRAAADLIDDPLPILHPLRQLPITLLHGYPGTYNWRVSVLEARRLVQWQHVSIGPGICDLITLIESFGLIQESGQKMRERTEWPISEETMIDTYFLRLGEMLDECDIRTLRQALPAARCLHILLYWFPRFNTWISQLPNNIDARRDIWRAISETNDDELAQSLYSPIAGLGSYLSATFHRFLRSYYQLVS